MQLPPHVEERDLLSETGDNGFISKPQVSFELMTLIIGPNSCENATTRKQTNLYCNYPMTGLVRAKARASKSLSSQDRLGTAVSLLRTRFLFAFKFGKMRALAIVHIIQKEKLLQARDISEVISTPSACERIASTEHYDDWIRRPSHLHISNLYS